MAIFILLVIVIVVVIVIKRSHSTDSITDNSTSVKQKKGPISFTGKNETEVQNAAIFDTSEERDNLHKWEKLLANKSEITSDSVNDIFKDIESLLNKMKIDVKEAYDAKYGEYRGFNKHYTYYVMVICQYKETFYSYYKQLAEGSILKELNDSALISKMEQYIATFKELDKEFMAI